MKEIKQITAEEQRKEIDRKFDERTKLALTVDPTNPDHKDNQAIAYSMCEDSFVFWCNNFCWIQDPEADDLKKKDIPFILYDYQEIAAEEVIKAVNEGYDLPIEKSRKMGLSWLLMAIIVWGWNFHKWDTLSGSQTRAKVDKAGDMDSLFEKARYMIRKTPKWMIPNLREKVNDKNLLLIHPLHRATISGESNNANFGRAGRRKVILFDEFSSWDQTDKAAWQSCGSTTRCRIPLSTPNTRGTNCHYYTVVKDAYRKSKPILRLHWTLNPVFADNLYYDDLNRPRSPWYDLQCQRATSLSEVSQELDIDYEASMAGKVFPDFDIETNVVDGLEYDESLPLYVAWDFGLDTTAMLWIQWDAQNRTFNIIDEYQNNGGGEGTDIYHYLDILDSKGYKAGIHFGDPQSGENRSLTSGTSNANILRRHGIIFRSKKTPIVTRVGAGRNLIKQVRLSDRCIIAKEMFTSWQLRAPKTGNTSSSIPDHGEYSHIGEAYTYFAFNYKNREVKKNVHKKTYAPQTSGVML